MGEAEMIAVDKIGMGAGLDPGEQRMGSPLGELVPSHMRDFERWIGGFDRNHLAADPTEALGGLEFPAAIRHQLHADADPEKWAAAGEHGLLEGIFEPGHRGEPAPAIGKRTHPRKTTRSAPATVSGSLVTLISAEIRFSAAARSNALAAERKLPEP